MIAITGATGQLGQLVIKHLLKKTDAKNIVAIVRDKNKAEFLKKLNIQIREADYTNSELLDEAFKGIDKLLLISSSEVGQRTVQHKNVIDSAKKTNVKLLAYTSLLHANSSPLSLAQEHIETEEYLKQQNIPHVLLRNGWYTENYLASIEPSLANNAFIGSAKNGKISSSAREDYAEAAAVVLTTEANQEGKIYELAGDESYTLAELCLIINEISGKNISYVDLPEREFADALISTGLPEGLALMLADSDVGASKGGLFDDSHVLSNLIGHPTKSLHMLVEDHIKKNS